MRNYANRMKEVKEIRKAYRHEALTRRECKKFTDKLSWLAAGTRPDLSYTT